MHKFLPLLRDRALLHPLWRSGHKHTVLIVSSLLLTLTLLMGAKIAMAEESLPDFTFSIDTGTNDTESSSTEGTESASSSSGSTSTDTAAAAPASETGEGSRESTQEQVQELLDNDAGLALSHEVSELLGSIDNGLNKEQETVLTKKELKTSSLDTLVQTIEQMDAAEEGSQDWSVTPEEVLSVIELKLQQRVAEVNNDDSLSEDEKKRSQTALENAQNLLDEYRTLRQSEQDFALEQQQAQKLLPVLERNLSQANEIYSKAPPKIESTDLDVVSALSDELSSQLVEVQHELSQATSTYNTLQTLPSRNQNQILANNERLSELQKQIDNLSTQDLLPDEQRVLPFELLVLQKQNALLQAQIRSLTVLQDVTSYKLHIFGLHKDYLEQYINQLHTYHSELLRDDLLSSEQEQNPMATQDQLPQLHNEFQYNQNFNGYIEQALALQSQLQRELQEVNLALNTTEQVENNLKEQLSDLSGSVILSRLLNRQQGELPEMEISLNLDEIIPNLNLWLYDLRGYREEIFDVQSYVDNMIQKHQELKPFREPLVQLIRQRRVLYEDLYNTLSDSLTTANELRNKYTELQSKGQRVRALINDHLFWLTSNQGISLDFFMGLLPNLREQSRELLDYLQGDFLEPENLINYLKLFVPFVLLGLLSFSTRNYFRRHNDALALRLDKDTDSYFVTPLAIFNHIFLIIPRVCLITILGSVVIFITLDQFADQIRLTCFLSLHVFCFLYMRHIMEPNSLEQRHFAVPPERLANSRMILDQIWYISIPMLTIANMREIEPAKIPSDTIGYLLMLLGFIYLTVFACIQTKNIITRTGARMSFIALALAGILTPLTISLMLALGYYYTVIQLLNRVAITLYLGFLYFILSQTLRRELHVAENKLTDYLKHLALKEQFASFSLNKANVPPGSANQEKNKNSANSGTRSSSWFGRSGNKRNDSEQSSRFNFTSRLFSNSLQDSESSSARKGTNISLRANESPRISATRLELISNRVFKLFNTFLMLIFLYFMYYQWNDLAGVLDYLNQIYLWQNTEVVDGKTVVSTLSLKDVLLSILIVVVTILLNRNIPMLIERVTLLRASNSAKSISYTLRLISSYLIIALGTIFAASALGISWDQLQWLVAALSVGLGFGLQEIFANFVSGIIILFERQIRVGDIVTLDGLSGTVSKIRIRATTIVSFENMEVVIPNRQFITTALTNWSLSNTITKIEFTIGIAYGSDINKAKDLLRGILRRCRDISRVQQPTVYVKSLDASAITIMCEVYVNEIGKRKAVFDFLSIEALRVFDENNIEVPFDQMDVTIRNLDTEQILKFIAAKHGMRPEEVSATFNTIHRYEEEEQEKEQEQENAQKAANGDDDDSHDKSKDKDSATDKDDKEEESVGSRLMRFIGIKTN